MCSQIHQDHSRLLLRVHARLGRCRLNFSGQAPFRSVLKQLLCCLMARLHNNNNNNNKTTTMPRGMGLRMVGQAQLALAAPQQSCKAPEPGMHVAGQAQLTLKPLCHQRHVMQAMEKRITALL
jgi:hypothetical protein